MRKYIDTSNFRAVLELPSIDLRGNDWPEARSYFDVSQLRAPYHRGFYQDNQLCGLGEVVAHDPSPAIPTWIVMLGAFGIGYAIATAVFKAE
jgi:hypothetical protein